MGGTLITLVAAAAATALAATGLAQRLARAGLYRLNYRGRPVVTGVGVALLAGPLAAAAAAALLAATPAWGRSPLPAAGVAARPAAAAGAGPVAGPGHGALLALLAATALIGLLDDLLDEPVRGWRGHLGRAARGRWTGGQLKLVLLPLAAWTLAPGLAAAERALGALLIAAAANGLNLLDRHPGRALKAFFAAWLLLAAWQPPAAATLLPVAAAALVLLPLDLGERVMLGDAGSNALGAALGWTLAAHLPASGQVSLVAGLLALHLLGEFYSLSRLIAAVPPLRWWDRLGTAAGASPPSPPAGPTGSLLGRPAGLCRPGAAAARGRGVSPGGTPGPQGGG